ncbi:MAG: ABC transporter permease [Candidatus Dormibacteraeota bacterium]|uniref:ABC transporter permease n=1 Tax=Candidatus Amunia macphersoniae TaxID=3127014 RepID=A0A934KGN9_9BACT|nr:ABC transporter permease [Candidatus Dormibacteraeota bacterium]
MSTLRYIVDNWDTLRPQVLDHLKIVGICVLVAAAAGLLLGIVAARSDRFAAFILALTSIILTVPSFALFGLLSIWVGLGDPPVIVGLILYALLPIVRNTREGIVAVDAAVAEAARGMGMTSLQVLARVELPLAVPVILAGLRQATVMVVAIATVGAAVGANDLGQPIFAALTRDTGTLEQVLAGVLPVALIGIVADVVLAAAQRGLSKGRVAVAAT